MHTNGDLLEETIINELLGAGLGEIKVTFHDPMRDDREEDLRELAGRYPITLIDLRSGHRTLPLSNRGGKLRFDTLTRPPVCYAVNTMVIRHTGEVVLCACDAQA